jgi:hypothetical protein
MIATKGWEAGVDADFLPGAPQAIAQQGISFRNQED